MQQATNQNRIDFECEGCGFTSFVISDEKGLILSKELGIGLTCLYCNKED